MKIILPIGGDDVGEHFKNIYHRMIMTHESVITSFNGITAVLFSDEDGFEHTKYPDRPYQQSVNLDAVKSYYMRELEKKEPSGYTNVKNFYDHYNEESKKARDKVKKVESIIETIKQTEQAHLTPPSIRRIREMLEDAVK